jgi:hypothetical protein
MADLPWREAVIQVLTEEGTALHYTDIADRIIERGLRTTIGATPWATVNVSITESLKKEGLNSPFARVDRGVYALKSVASTPVASNNLPAADPSDVDTSDVEEARLVHAFGMYWERTAIHWSSNPKLMGRQQIKASPVDFARQRGVYLLYDGRHVVYVGRVTDRDLGVRLYEHTQDRLRGRWNRFSWFGLLSVTEDGQLRESKCALTPDLLAATLEALLVEGLEPPQNRRRGDGFTAVEYLQADDPTVKNLQLIGHLADLQSKLLAT